MTAALRTSNPLHSPAITLSPRSAYRHQPSAATYRRRRAVVGTTLAVLVAVGSVAAHDVLAGSGGVPASAAESQPAHARERIVVQPGDTLWSIASAHHGHISMTRYVDALVDLNGGATIQVAQEIVLP
jgi:Tfp pilus assembly protein FimV